MRLGLLHVVVDRDLTEAAWAKRGRSTARRTHKQADFRVVDSVEANADGRDLDGGVGIDLEETGLDLAVDARVQEGGLARGLDVDLDLVQVEVAAGVVRNTGGLDVDVEADLVNAGSDIGGHDGGRKDIILRNAVFLDAFAGGEAVGRRRQRAAEAGVDTRRCAEGADGAAVAVIAEDGVSAGRKKLLSSVTSTVDCDEDADLLAGLVSTDASYAQSLVGDIELKAWVDDAIDGDLPDRLLASGGDLESDLVNSKARVAALRRAAGAVVAYDEAELVQLSLSDRFFGHKAQRRVRLVAVTLRIWPNWLKDARGGAISGNRSDADQRHDRKVCCSKQPGCNGTSHRFFTYDSPR